MTHLKNDEKPKKKTFRKSDQFASELIYFSSCVLKNRMPETSAYEGRADVRAILAILESIDKKRPISLKEGDRVPHPEPSQMIKKPPVDEPDTVHVTAPTH
jgi:hypothetical protein